MCLLKQTRSLQGKKVHRVFCGRRNQIETKHTLHIRAERRTDLIMCNKSVVRQRKKSQCVFLQECQQWEKPQPGDWQQTSALRPGERSEQAFPCCTLRLSRLWNNAMTGFGLQLKRGSLKKKNLFPLCCAQLGWFIGAYFIDYGTFFCFTVKPDVFRFSGGFLDVERD